MLGAWERLSPIPSLAQGSLRASAYFKSPQHCLSMSLVPGNARDAMSGTWLEAVNHSLLWVGLGPDGGSHLLSLIDEETEIQLI